MEPHGAIAAPEAAPVVSVILPVRNEASSLPELLAALAEQDFPAQDFELIVADGRSTDSTRAMVRRFAQSSSVAVKMVDNPGILSSAGRNAGLRAARGEYILFIDGHCHIPSRRLISDMVRLFRESDAECLCRPQPLMAPVSGSLGRSIAAVRGSILGHGRESLIYDMTKSGFVDPASSGAAYRRGVFTIAGIYDERFDACEDVEFNTRIRKSGMKAYTDPRLAVYYAPRTTLSGLWKQMTRYGRGRTRLIFKHPDCLTAGQMAPAVLAAWIAAAVLCWVAGFPESIGLRLLICSPIILYAGMVMLFSAALAWKRQPSLVYEGPAIYCVIHLGLGFGLWMEAVRSAWSFVVRRVRGVRGAAAEF